MCDDEGMRTTLTVDDDVLAAARQLAANRGVSVGDALSQLARAGLQGKPASAVRNGIALLPAGGARATLDDVNELRDESA